MNKVFHILLKAVCMCVISINYYFHHIIRHQFNNAIRLNEVDSCEWCFIYPQNNKRNFWSVRSPGQSIYIAMSLAREASNEKFTLGRTECRVKEKKEWQKLRRDYWRIRGSPDFKRRGNNAPRTLVRSRPFLSTPVSGVVAWPEWSFNYVARLPLIRHSTSSAPRESREIASPFFPPTIGLLATPCRRMERKRARKDVRERRRKEKKKREKKTVGWVGELAK